MYQFVDRSSCPVCGAEKTTQVYVSAYTDGAIAKFVREYYQVDPHLLEAAPFELRSCARCTTVYQRYVGDAELMRALYTEWQLNMWKWDAENADPELLVPAYGASIREPRLSLFAHEIMTASAFLGVPLQSMKTLDYGMGYGLWVRIAAALGCDSYGLEVSQPAVDYVRRHGCKTIEDAELSQHKFHFVNTEQVFEHVPEPGVLLSKLAAALHPGGLIKISVPSGESAPRIVAALQSGGHSGEYKDIMPVQPLEHINTFTRESIRAMARNNGLAVVRPTLLQSYSFLRHRGVISPSRPRQAIKELVRPIFQWRDPRNIYMWLQRDSAP
jgi:2-polyprenyl-3-methyl-5-hydroxy-6-metoxy-1,4-benzoquinol methylase